MTTATPQVGTPTTASPLGTSAGALAARPAPWARSYALRLSLGDTLAVIVGILGVHALRFGIDIELIPARGVMTGILNQGQVSLGLAAVWLLSLKLFDTRSRRMIGAGSTEYKRVVDASVFTFVLYLVAAYFLQLDISRLWALLVFPVTAGLAILGRWLWRQWLIAQRRAGRYSSQVVLVGSKKSVTATARDLLASPQHGYVPVAASLTGNAQPFGLSVGGHMIPVLAGIKSVPAAMSAFDANTVMVTGSQHLSAEKIREMSWGLDPHRHQLLLAPSITDVAGSRVHLRPVAGLPLVHVETPDYDGPQWMAKRAFDVTLAALMMLAFLPVFAVIAAFIKREDGGPVFYTQQRVGKDGEVFKILKFRSMYVDADARRAALVAAAGTGRGLFKMQDDPRVTPIGKIIRKYSLDELPQLINVLRGDMSLVGPRPALPEEVDGYDRKERRRLVVTPGLSGLWQVSGRSDLAWEDGIRLDLYYVENWSMTGDLVILWRTAKTVLFPQGAY
ncbi:MAG: sugar transferase [Naasia sp.]